METCRPAPPRLFSRARASLPMRGSAFAWVVLALLSAGCAADPLPAPPTAVVGRAEVTVAQDPLIAVHRLAGDSMLGHRLAGLGTRDPQQVLTFTATPD